MYNVLFVDMGYVRKELNEPINVDVILQNIEDSLIKNISIDINYKIFEDDILENKVDIKIYDLILISSKLTSTYEMLDIMEKNREIPIIVGGVIATYAFEFICKSENIICSLGESEANLNELLKICMENSNCMSVIKHEIKNRRLCGIYFIDNRKPFFSAIKTIDLGKNQLPLRHSTVDLIAKRGGLVRVEGSRGCPWNNCSFCSMKWKYGGHKWRKFPEEKVIKEIEALSNMGVSTIYFTDEDFIGNYERCKNLFGEILRLKNEGRINEVKFWGATSVWTFMKMKDNLDECLMLLKLVGVEVLFIGIESGCNNQLIRYKKGVTAENNAFILRKIIEYDFKFDIGFIMFDAETSIAEIKENMRFIYDNKLNAIVSRLAKPLRVIPFTDLCKVYEEKEYLIGDLDIDELNYQYEFRDKEVEKLYKSLMHITNKIIDRANEIQALIRISNGYIETDSVSIINRIRNLEYDFIMEYIEIYEKSMEILDGQIDFLINKYDKLILSLNS